MRSPPPRRLQKRRRHPLHIAIPPMHNRSEHAHQGMSKPLAKGCRPAIRHSGPAAPCKLLDRGPASLSRTVSRAAALFRIGNPALRFYWPGPPANEQERNAKRRSWSGRETVVHRTRDPCSLGATLALIFPKGDGHLRFVCVSRWFADTSRGGGGACRPPLKMKSSRPVGRTLAALPPARPLQVASQIRAGQMQRRDPLVPCSPTGTPARRAGANFSWAQSSSTRYMYTALARLSSSKHKHHGPCWQASLLPAASCAKVTTLKLDVPLVERSCRPVAPVSRQEGAGDSSKGGRAGGPATRRPSLETLAASSSKHWRRRTGAGICVRLRSGGAGATRALRSVSSTRRRVARADAIPD